MARPAHRLLLRNAPGAPAALLLACVAYALPGSAVAGDPASRAAGFGPAVDWSLKGRVSASTAVDLNRNLLPDESDALLSTSRLDTGLTLGAQTKRGVYTADIGLVGIVYLGPDQPEIDQPVDPRFAASAVYSGKRYEFSNNFSFDIQPTTETQFDDTGIISGTALQLSVNYSAALAYEVTKRDSLTFSASAAVIDFLEGRAPNLTPTRSATTGVRWARALNERTSIGLDTSLRYFTSENAVDTHSQTLTVGANFRQQRTRRHEIGLGLGVTFVRTEDLARGTSFDVGFDGSAEFGYTLKDMTFDLSLSQGIEPSSVGRLQSFTRAGAGFSWTVNPQETLSASLDYTRRTGLGTGVTGGGDAFNSVTANASYAFMLTRETSLSLGYRFRVRDDSVGFATGHQVLLTLSHDFTLLP